MGNKDKRQDRYRSRSRDRVAHKSKSKKQKRPRSYSDESSSNSRSRSPVHKTNHQRKKHKSCSKSSSDSVSDNSGSDSTHSRSRSRYKKEDRHERRQRSRDRQQSRTDNAMRQEEDMERLKDEMRQQKELNKRFETPEEKRARRLAKKDSKERKRKAKMGWDQEYLGYTNADNPFGDEHLLETFMWQKKNEKEGKKDECINELHKQQTQKMEENRVELEKVKKRRLEREKEREVRDQETEMLQRDKEAEYYRVWEKQEDSFHLQQAKLRSKIRIEDGRAKPIDLLAKYISAEDDELAIEMHEPYTCLSGLTIADLEDLLEDIKVYLEMEQGKNADYWRDIIIVAEDEIGKLKKIDPTSREYLSDRREGINQSVSSEISNLFKGKTTNQLVLLEHQINNKLKGGEGIDIGYWESLVQELKAHMARTRLRERHQEVLRQKLFKLKNEQGIQSAPLFPVIKESAEISENSTPVIKTEASEQDKEPTAGPSFEESGITESVLTEADLNQDLYDEAAGYSPKLLKTDSLDIDSVIYNEEDDLKKLELARTQVRTTGKVKLDVETEFEKKAREGMNDDEAQFSVEVALDQQAFLWSDKYRPRKPRFFNRVHTGFEWNKYNQTHYDIDNPPPKIVQGYKFNIFYPDLIDKTETPEYTLTLIDGVRDFSTLKFHAGPPYEDIAFKVVNREWEYSYKRGFRCQFQNNIFQLWFHFKRYRYRR